jgi:hypothetical protein
VLPDPASPGCQRGALFRKLFQSVTTAVAADPLAGIGEVELVAEGFQFTEGPQWIEYEGGPAVH